MAENKPRSTGKRVVWIGGILIFSLALSTGITTSFAFQIWMGIIIFLILCSLCLYLYFKVID